MKITANLCTIPSRVHLLPKVIYSIIGQVDLVRVYLNGHKELPACVCNNPKIEYFWDTENKGDAMKFFWALNPDEYYFTLDDDIIYPHTHISDYLLYLEQFNYAVCSMGYIFTSFPVKNVYESIHNIHTDRIYFGCFDEIKKDYFVHIGGSGTAAFNTNVLKIDYHKFEHKNMADIYFSVFAKQQNVPILVISHTKDYFKNLLPANEKNTICNDSANNTVQQVKIINSINWYK